MIKNRQRLVAVLVTVVGGLGVFAAPSASANPADVGGIAFNCSVTLTFPGSSPPLPAATCTGTWTGVIVDGGVAHTGGALVATVNYNEPCPPVLGTATAKVVLSDGTGWSTTEYITWTRVGASAAITVSDAPGGTPDGAGTAAFVVIPPASSLIPPCPSSPVTATVAGSAAWT